MVAYNPLYPTNRMVVESLAAATQGWSGCMPAATARYEAVGVYGHISNSQTLVDSPTILGALDEPCTPGEIAAVGRHLRELVAGTDPWVYSSAPQRHDPADLRRRLGLRPDAPVVVALLSSPDETRASTLVDAEFHRDPVRGYSHLGVHPDGPGPGGGPTGDRRRPAPAPAPDAEQARDRDVAGPRRDPWPLDLPANAHVNAPGDGVSLYDLVGIAAAAVNQSSSSGLEFSVGLPVVSFDPVRQGAYPPWFGPCVERGDGTGMAAAVDEALASGRRLDRCVAAFRWYATITLRDLLRRRTSRLSQGRTSSRRAHPSARPSPSARRARPRLRPRPSPRPRRELTGPASR